MDALLAVAVLMSGNLFLGEHQNSDTLRQLRHLIQSRRQTPEMAVGWWKWGMTMIGGIAEIVVHVF